MRDMTQEWEAFKDIETDKNECTKRKFLNFPKGTHRFDIWDWFDEHHVDGVQSLIEGSNIAD